MTLTARRVFVLASGLALAATTAVLAVVELPPFAAVSAATDEISQSVAPIVAALACLWASRQVGGRARLGWILLAISAVIWATGQSAYTVQTFALHQKVAFPSFDDVCAIASVPFAVAAIRAFWGPPRGTPSRWRVWLDASIVALALTFTAWALGLRVIWAVSDPPVEKFFELAYPVGDIAIGTVLILALRRAASRQQARMFLLFAGLAANSVSNSAFSYLTVTRSGGFESSALDVGWVAGYLLIALAAIAPRPVRQPAPDDSPVDLWQLALPWLTVSAAGASALYLALTGQHLDAFLTALTGVGAVLLSANMVLTSRDFLEMLLKSRASEASLAEVIGHAPVGMVRLGTDLRITNSNPAFATLMRVEGKQDGRPIRSYFRGADASRLYAALGRLRSAAGIAEDDIEARHPDGSTTWVHWTATAVRGGEGELLFYVAMFEDTTARHRAEAAAEASLGVLNRLNRLKTEFLQSVSHEFKTALIGIQGFSELMRDADELDVNDARTFAADIHRDAERLDRMVTEMLALDRVETTRANIRIRRVDLDTVIRREVEATQRKIERNSVELDIQPELPDVAGDEDKLSEVVRSLLDSAVKRSPEDGRITVTASAHGTDVEVGVNGEGAGAMAEFDNRLFSDSDVYANNPIRKVVSTGLELGIARQVIEMHGGRLWVAAGGYEVRFTVPAMPPVAVS